MALNDTLDRMDLTDIFRTFHPKGAEYTFFLNAHGTFSRKDHLLGHRSAFNKYKKINIILCIFSDHNVMKHEIIGNYLEKNLERQRIVEIKEHPTKESMG